MSHIVLPRVKKTNTGGTDRMDSRQETSTSGCGEMDFSF